MTDDPRSIGEKLASVASIIGARTVPGPDDYDDPEEFGASRADGLEAIRAQRWRQVIPGRFSWADLPDFDGCPVSAQLTEWAADAKGRNLVIFGPVGAGKSHAAVAACRPAFFFRGLDVRFVPIVELLDRFRPGGPPDAFDDLCYLDRLILDDLGSEKVTDWTAERLSALINRRWLEELPTVVTSNLQPEALEEHVGAPTFSRLIGSGAVSLRLVDTDRRRAR